MFKEFWNKRKNIIEASGILIAIGAIFLSIPLPDDLIARSALIQTQLVWFFVITIFVIIIAFNFLIYISKIENLMKKKGFEFDASLSLLLLFLVFWFLFHLWQYLVTVYHDQYLNLSKYIFIIIIPILLYFFIWIFKKIRKIYKNRWSFFLCTLLLLSLAIGIIYASITSIVFLKFELIEFLSLITISTLVFFTIGIFSHGYLCFKK